MDKWRRGSTNLRDSSCRSLLAIRISEGFLLKNILQIRKRITYLLENNCRKIFSDLYTGPEKMVCKTYLRRTQARPSSRDQEQQEGTSPNHVQAIFSTSVSRTPSPAFFLSPLLARNFALRTWFTSFHFYLPFLTSFYHIIASPAASAAGAKKRPLAFLHAGDREQMTQALRVEGGYPDYDQTDGKVGGF